MKKHVSFSEEDKEKASLDFFELRQKGLEFLQELSGDIWTDFNSHDPGITILEQLCYALTDVALRSSYKVQDLLYKENSEGKYGIDYEKNGFYSPSKIFSKHPVTEIDLKKVLLDNFYEIQNVWITYTDTSGLVEKIVLIEKVEILPKTVFNKMVDEEVLKQKVKSFLTKNRNLGEDVEDIVILSAENICIELEIHLQAKEVNHEEILANVFLDLFEFFYLPIKRYTFEEMVAEKNEVFDIFSGPRMSHGFIKDESFDQKRITNIKTEEIEQILSKRNRDYVCKVRSLCKKEGNENKKNENNNVIYELKSSEGKFFHLLDQKAPGDASYKAFETLFSNITIKSMEGETIKRNDQKVDSFYENVYHLFYELWTKKYRPYNVKIQESEFAESLEGALYEIENYHSIQNDFPLFYGIGKESLPQSVPKDRHAKAKQLKAYLLLFEQQLANSFSQISHLDDLFDVKLSQDKRTYFTQSLLKKVPNIEEIYQEEEFKKTFIFEDKDLFFNRKNRIYDHMLARFGEHFVKTTFKGLKNKEEAIKGSKPVDEANFNDKFLDYKSQYLQKIVEHTSNSLKGENFLVEEKSNKQESTQGLNEELLATRAESDLSGLESIILAKTGLPLRNRREKRDKEDKKENHYSFYVVDHVLLRDFLIPGKDTDKVEYGFKFVNAEGETLCSTTDEYPWCQTEKERETRINKLFKLVKDHEGLFKSSVAKNGNGELNIVLKELDIKDKGKVLASFTKKCKNKDDVLDLLSLCNRNHSSNNELRLNELEAIRFQGNHKINRGYYGQRKLIFQRKIDSSDLGEKVTIDEDFFNLSISVILLNDEILDDSNNKSLYQFNINDKSIIKSMIRELVPSHIHLNVCFIDKWKMKLFEMKYQDWEYNKTKYESQNNNLNDYKELKKSAHFVYKKVKEILDNDINMNKYKDNNRDKTKVEMDK